MAKIIGVLPEVADVYLSIEDWPPESRRPNPKGVLLSTIQARSLLRGHHMTRKAIIKKLEVLEGLTLVSLNRDRPFSSVRTPLEFQFKLKWPRRHERTDDRNDLLDWLQENTTNPVQWIPDLPIDPVTIALGRYADRLSFADYREATAFKLRWL